MYTPLIPIVAVVAILLIVMMASLHSIGATEIGLVNKRFGKKLRQSNVIAMNGEAGYQAALLMPGWRFKLWPIFHVVKHPWVQVPAGEIGVVISQVGNPVPIGAKSAVYKPAFGNFNELKVFLDEGGQKGVQRPVLPPGTMVPIHPVAFLVITASRSYGVPVSREYEGRRGLLDVATLGLTADQLRVKVIEPKGTQDVIGVVTTLEGDPLSDGHIAGRLGGYTDIKELQENPDSSDALVIQAILNTKNGMHNNYQDFQAFLDHGGKIGLQHDPLLYGAYLLNPFLVRVEIVPMLVVEQGEVAVIKSYVGLPTEDTSGESFKHGSIVKPGHQGLWREPLRTSKYPINPRCYAHYIVPTSILTLNWAEAVSEAHKLDAGLSQIEGKSREGFVFGIDLQVQIHIPDTLAPKVISMVGTMQALVNEVLQSAVGNYFRNALQQLPAVEFIETRDQVQAQAEAHIREYLEGYQVETRGVYIQDVVLPEALVEVLQEREIAHQQQATFEQQRMAQETRTLFEAARGTAEMQLELAKSNVRITITGNDAQARENEAKGQAAFTFATGKAEAQVIEAKGLATATATEAIGLAQAAAYEAQVRAVGAEATAAIAVMGEVGKGNVRITPDVQVGAEGSSLDALMATLTGKLAKGETLASLVSPVAVAPAAEASTEEVKA
jgi:regulator of protease activity HflC (stomatin/prohibitin superfamily)